MPLTLKAAGELDGVRRAGRWWPSQGRVPRLAAGQQLQHLTTQTAQNAAD